MSLVNVLGEDWYNLIGSEFRKDYLKNLSFKINYGYQSSNQIIPAKEDIFKAFNKTRLENIKVVILGQSPYPDGRHANGLAFASKKKEIPNSLEIILYSINKECIFGTDIREYCFLDAINNQDYSLQYWVDQGILLLNSQYTCEKGNPSAHKNLGWEQFNSFLISKLVETKKNISFLAWGRDAENIMNPIFMEENKNNHFYLSCEHPIVSSYQKRNWNNRNCFIEVNRFRRMNNLKLISW